MKLAAILAALSTLLAVNALPLPVRNFKVYYSTDMDAAVISSDGTVSLFFQAVKGHSKRSALIK